MLAPWKKSYGQPNSILKSRDIKKKKKSRDITLPTKVHLVKAMVFPVVMYGCESWTIKSAERQRIDAFELWCWRRLLRVLWTARRSNQPILKEISPKNSLEGLMLKLKLQYFGHLMQRTDSLEKYPDAGQDWRWEEKGVNWFPPGSKAAVVHWDGPLWAIERQICAPHISRWNKQPLLSQFAGS